MPDLQIQSKRAEKNIKYFFRAMMLAPEEMSAIEDELSKEIAHLDNILLCSITQQPDPDYIGVADITVEIELVDKRNIERTAGKVQEFIQESFEAPPA